MNDQQSDNSKDSSEYTFQCIKHSMVKDDKPANSLKKVASSRKKYIQITLQYAIYAIILTAALLREISFEAPSSVIVTTEDCSIRLADGSVQIQILQKMAFFIEEINNQFTSIVTVYFVMRYAREYPKITKILMNGLFTKISHSEISSYFPCPTDYRGNVRAAASLACLTAVHYILGGKRCQTSSLFGIAAKSMLLTVAFLIFESTLGVCKCIMASLPIDFHLKDAPELLTPVEKFCKDSGFRLSNIHILNSKSGFIQAFAYPLLFKRFSHIFFSKEALMHCADSLVGPLCHEVGHLSFINQLYGLLINFVIFFTVFLFTDRFIIPNLDKHKLLDYVRLGSALAILTKLIEYGANLLSMKMEYSCDDGALSDPESAASLAKFLAAGAVLSLDSRNFLKILLAFSKSSVLHTHPPTLDRLIRIAEKYPELVKIQVNYENNK